MCLVFLLCNVRAVCRYQFPCRAVQPVIARERRAVCQYITANYGYNCVTFNYRLAPENLWSAPLEGCLTAYAARLKTGASPKDVVFMGESAGGTLVLSLALLLKEKGFPQPKRWCLSPPV